MDELIYFISIFCLGYWTASMVFSWKINQLLKEVNDNTILPKIPTLSTESIDGCILLYDAKKNFLCQGKSIEEVAQNLFKYKQVKVAMIDHDNYKLWFVNGKVEKLNEN